MKTHFLVPVLAVSLLPLAGCNLFGGLSSPSSDPQYLVAARACLDRGDYQCALDNYRALSGNQNDIKVSETSLTQLAQANIFSFSDLISSLGGATGSGGSFATMANDLARRGAASETNRLLIQSIYTNNSQINPLDPNDKLRAFSKFLAAISMVNEILAEIAGPDHTLTASDIVANPSACNSCNSSCNVGTTNVLGTSATPSGVGIITGWSGTVSLQMLIAAAQAADDNAVIFKGGSSSNNSGIFSAMNSLLGIPGGDNCIREKIVQIFGLN
jgi:hypothetical protein